MFTPEDEIDVLHEELGRWRRRLHDAETAHGEWRLCSYVEVRKACSRYRFEISRLERALADELARLDEADEAYGPVRKRRSDAQDLRRARTCVEPRMVERSREVLRSLRQVRARSWQRGGPLMPGLRDILDAATPGPWRYRERDGMVLDADAYFVFKLAGSPKNAELAASTSLAALAPELAALVLDMGEELRMRVCPCTESDYQEPDCPICPLLARLDQLGKEPSDG